MNTSVAQENLEQRERIQKLSKPGIGARGVETVEAGQERLRVDLVVWAIDVDEARQEQGEGGRAKGTRMAVVEVTSALGDVDRGPDVVELVADGPGGKDLFHRDEAQPPTEQDRSQQPQQGSAPARGADAGRAQGRSVVRWVTAIRAGSTTSVHSSAMIIPTTSSTPRLAIPLWPANARLPKLATVVSAL